ncbi:MAG: PAS domain S-box protein [Rhodocyclales bacterium]|nr:PAS domain S-box protein [Rhodocyclales bacterium]
MTVNPPSTDPHNEEIARLRSALDDVGAYVFTKDREGRYTYANRMVCELFGAPLAGIVGRADEDFFDLSVSNDLRVNDRQVLDTGVSIEREERTVVAQTGETRYYWAVKKPLRDAGGTIVGLIGVSTDITARKQAEVAMGEAQARFRELFEQAPLGIWLMDGDSRIVECNAKFADYAGAPRERIIGFRMLEEAQYPALAAPIGRALRGEACSIDAEYRSTTGGRSGVYRFHFQPHYSAGELRGVLAFAEDIGEARRIENALKDREALLTKIFDTASVAIFLVDPQGVITHANQCMAEMFGCPLSALVGREYVACVHPQERETARAKMLALLASTVPSVDLERLYWREDGSEFWGRLTGRRFQDALGTELGLVGVIADITEGKLARQRVEAERQRFRDLVDSTSGIVWEGDAQTFAFTFVSQEAERLLGYPVDDWYRPGFWVEHLHPDDRSWAVDYCASCTGRLENHDFEYRFIARDGRTVWLRDIVKVVEEDGAPRWLRGVMVDITASKRASQRHASVVESAMDGFVVFGPDGRVREHNRAFCALTGYAAAEVVTLAVGDFDAMQTADEIAARIRRIVGEGGDRFETRWRRRGGEIIDVEVTATYLSLGEEICAFVRDITVLKEHDRQLDRIAHYDSLTGVPNRTLLADRMKQALAQAHRARHMLAICYLDLDGFKPINDNFGHDTGDHVLVEVAARLQDCLRASDTVSRVGGDEFVLLLQGIDDLDECKLALARILGEIARPMTVDGHDIRLSGSLGVALYPKDDADSDTLLRHADQAMYLAKQGGRNRFHLFDPEHDRLARERTERLVRIVQAQRDREFVLYYQPQVDMRLGRVVGAEALIRWQHPQRGVLPPADFLSVIEDSELIVEVGDWVIATALAQLEAWRRAGLSLRVGVNVAARHLLHADFAARLQAHLAAFPAVPPQSLELEILETAALEDIEHVSRVIRECRALGVSFSLDDFGTGYSSLAYLKSLPAETVKIDQTFVRDMLVDAEDRAIVEGVIGLARVFRREVIAEGVETAAHGALLLRLGCDLAQGYGIARPMPAADLPAWIEAWQPDPGWRSYADAGD